MKKIVEYNIDIWIGCPRFKAVDSFKATSFKEIIKMLKRNKLLLELKDCEVKISLITWRIK